jgi:NAD-dependent dihydropyrimidine dehydrogenase PreA subunit
MAAAPEGAIYRREDGLVVIDPEKSKGCKDVVAACPTQSIFWNEALQIPQKCTGCAHLLDSGWKAPRCVDACPTDALRFGDYEDFAQELEGAEPRNELAGNGPKVFYLNLPKRFIATTIMDRSVNEVLVGLDVDVKLGDEVVRTVQTDDFGDVFVDQIEPGDYILSFEVNNKIFEVPANCVKEDCVIADFDVSK